MDITVAPISREGNRGTERFTGKAKVKNAVLV